MITMTAVTLLGLICFGLKIAAEVAAQNKFERENKGMPTAAEMRQQIIEADIAEAAWLAKENAKKAATTVKEWKNA